MAKTQIVALWEDNRKISKQNLSWAFTKTSVKEKFLPGYILLPEYIYIYR